MQSAIHSRPVSAAIRLTSQSATRKMQHRCRRSELELRGPRNGLRIDPRGSRGMRCASLHVEIPNLTTKAGIDG
eukprot:3511295-Alexandrium_andersonii.AAC.1